MSNPNHTRKSQSPSFEIPEYFLTPEQRLEAVAEILATIAARVVKKRKQQIL
jgi:hypothetical protein